MRTVILIISMLAFSTLSFAGGVVAPPGDKSATSVLYKTFEKNTANNNTEDRWILIRTDGPDFSYPDLREGMPKLFSGEGRTETAGRALHERIVRSFLKAGWQLYYLPQDPTFISEEAENLGNGIYVYREKPRKRGYRADEIVEYRMNVKPDVQTTFEDRGRITFVVEMPEFGDPMWSTFKYRGEDPDEFLDETIAQAFDAKLKENHQYR